jgi:hypothetical protein
MMTPTPPSPRAGAALPLAPASSHRPLFRKGPRSPRRRRRQLERLSGRDVIDVVRRRSSNWGSCGGGGAVDASEDGAITDDGNNGPREQQLAPAPPCAEPLPPPRHTPHPPQSGAKTERAVSLVVGQHAVNDDRRGGDTPPARAVVSARPTVSRAVDSTAPAIAADNSSRDSQTLMPGTDEYYEFFLERRKRACKESHERCLSWTSLEERTIVRPWLSGKDRRRRCTRGARQRRKDGDLQMVQQLQLKAQERGRAEARDLMLELVRRSHQLCTFSARACVCILLCAAHH